MAQIDHALSYRRPKRGTHVASVARSAMLAGARRPLCDTFSLLGYLWTTFVFLWLSGLDRLHLRRCRRDLQDSVRKESSRKSSVQSSLLFGAGRPVPRVYLCICLDGLTVPADISYGYAMKWHKPTQEVSRTGFPFVFIQEWLMHLENVETKALK